MNNELISSTANPRIKHLLSLQQKSQVRRKEGLFVVEGRRELEHCMEAGLRIDTLLICPQIAAQGETSAQWERMCPGADVIQIAPQLYERIAYRGSTEGVMAVVQSRELTLQDLSLPENPLIVVLERVEKPGNLGAVLRSADAAAADCVIVCDTPTDLYNPNLIRSSIGAIFSVPCVSCTSQECIAFLRERGIQILTAQLQDSHLYYDTPMTQGTAIVMGTEATGLTPIWREAADAHIRIPMLGRLDSLNVSVSTAILLFEAVRQRHLSSSSSSSSL